jgi:hypothetical protein
MRNASICITPGRLLAMTRAVTVRLDEADHAALEKQADQLRVRPGTLARMLLHAELTGHRAAAGNDAARTALDRLVMRSQRRATGDAVALVADARVAFEPRR